MQITPADRGLLHLASPGVSGVYKPAEALERLLQGTGVTYRFTGAVTAVLELSKVVTAVDVTASVDDLAASTLKYAAPLEDTPQTVSVVPQSVIEQQNATTLRDTLRNVAGISLAAGEGGAQGDNLTIRGFSARNDLFIDGMRDFGSYYRDPFNTQEVEVLQGPSSVTFGRGSTGGVVNQASKSPMLAHSISADIDGGTDATRRGTLDFNTPVPALGKGTAFRLNLMGNEGNVAGRDIAENRRFGIAPSLAFGLGTPTRLTLSYFHQTADDIPDYGIPWLLNGPAPVNRTNYYGFNQDSNFLRTYDDIGTIRAEHDLNSHLTIRNQVRYASYLRRAQITEAQLLAPPSGPITAATPLSTIDITRNEITVNSVESFFNDQFDLTANFKTGSIRHAVVTGVEAGREISDPTRPKYTNVPTTSLLNPDPNQIFSGTETISSDVHTTSNSEGIYALDTVQLGRKWQAMGGLRWDRFNTHYTQNIAPATAFNRLDEMPTWRAGIVYKPVAFGSIYVSAGTSFNPSAESLSLSASNANLPPEKNRTMELGTKWDIPGTRFVATAALFRTDKTNAREPDPTNSLLNVLAGNQRVDGAQFGVSGHVTRRWEVLSSYAYLDAKVESSNFYPASVGARLANVPRHTFNFWNEYRLPAGWEIGAGVNFVGSRTASSTVPLDPVTGLVKQVPGYWVFNAMAEHRLNEHVRLQGNVYNIANRYYYDQLHPAHIILGAGRSALVGLKFNF
ncbi:MAG TPA: TonB-dependent siderophore receptor [Bryobacteraceae bacterium]|nr:TonB-dependent siderophore receptor [Bryobacteraceae bacterium]